MMRAVIFGCAGETLNDEERKFFKRVQPVGFILFERNCQNPPQLKKLVADLKETVERDDVMILIDREGGRISRLNHMYWRTPPAPQEFGDLYDFNSDLAYQACYDNALLIGNDLSHLGINVNCAPIADLPTYDSHPFLLDRSFSSYSDVSYNLCLAMAQGLQDMGVVPVLKHMPGHGRTHVDSHDDLPIITASKTELYETDFACFKNVLTYMNQLLRPTPWGMLAHAVYTAFDDKLPATYSSTIIDNVIRGYLDFQGFLISDCLTMKALRGSMSERTEMAMKAGCDTVLHCSGNLAEMVEIASVIPCLGDTALEVLEDSMPIPTHNEINVIELETSIKKSFDQMKATMARRM
jgi:beta-N-acetylhexosaminidase